MELKISDVAKLVGRHPQTLRDYEERGVIPTAKRDPIAGWRVYSRQDVEAIQRILAGEKKTPISV